MSLLPVQIFRLEVVARFLRPSAYREGVLSILSPSESTPAGQRADCSLRRRVEGVAQRCGARMSASAGGELNQKVYGMIGAGE